MTDNSLVQGIDKTIFMLQLWEVSYPLLLENKEVILL